VPRTGKVQRSVEPSIGAFLDAEQGVSIVVRPDGSPQVLAHPLGRWLVQADVDAGARPGASSDEQAEIKRLRAENRRLREDNEILRTATGFFASMPS
jgi:transposase